MNVKYLINRAVEEFLKVEAIGGVITAIEWGYNTRHITDGAIGRQREFERRERVAIGVNKYRTESKIPLGAFRIDSRIEAKQVERLKRVKKERKQKPVRETWEYIREVTNGCKRSHRGRGGHDWHQHSCWLAHDIITRNYPFAESVQSKRHSMYCWGIIPAEDIPVLKEMGVNEIFPPETPTSEIIDFVRNLIEGP